jgi:hypothetical protein
VRLTVAGDIVAADSRQRAQRLTSERSQAGSMSVKWRRRTGWWAQRPSGSSRSTRQLSHSQRSTLALLLAQREQLAAGEAQEGQCLLAELRTQPGGIVDPPAVAVLEQRLDTQLLGPAADRPEHARRERCGARVVATLERELQLERKHPVELARVEAW